MTKQEATALDLVVKQLDRMEDKIDNIDARLRTVETAQAGDDAHEVADAAYKNARYNYTMIKVGGIGVFASIILGVANLINLHIT